jgi:hypothetical protein
MSRRAPDPLPARARWRACHAEREPSSPVAASAMARPLCSPSAASTYVVEKEPVLGGRAGGF